jgi:ribosome-binding protein aMBF1 (putative translation factor)
MKNIIKKDRTTDPMAEARKNKKFALYSKEAAIRIKLGVEIYQARTAKGLSQQELARLTKTTQKMISNIESGNVDARFSTINKIKEALGFKIDNWARIFDFSVPVCKQLQRAN